jgi:hypothetical protein
VFFTLLCLFPPNYNPTTTLVPAPPPFPAHALCAHYSWLLCLPPAFLPRTHCRVLPPSLLPAAPPSRPSLSLSAAQRGRGRPQLSCNPLKPKSLPPLPPTQTALQRLPQMTMNVGAPCEGEISGGLQVAMTTSRGRYARWPWWRRGGVMMQA